MTHLIHAGLLLLAGCGACGGSSGSYGPSYASERPGFDERNLADDLSTYALDQALPPQCESIRADMWYGPIGGGEGYVYCRIDPDVAEGWYSKSPIWNQLLKLPPNPLQPYDYPRFAPGWFQPTLTSTTLTVAIKPTVPEPDGGGHGDLILGDALWLRIAFH